MSDQALQEYMAELQLHPDTRPALAEAARAIHRELWAFEWSRGDGQSLGDVSVDGDQATPRLYMRVFVEDNDNPDAEGLEPSNVRVDILPLEYENARSQLRSLIHMHLCHEADEQLRFNGERPFYPHHQHPGQAA